MSNINEVFETLTALFEGQNYTPEERSRIAGFAKNKLDVPGIIWSPKDLDEYLPEDLTDSEKNEVRNESYETLAGDNDLSDSDWENIRVTVELESNYVKMNRPILLDTIYFLDFWEETITEQSPVDRNHTPELMEDIPLDSIPTGHELYGIVPNDNSRRSEYLILHETSEGLVLSRYNYS